MIPKAYSFEHAGMVDIDTHATLDRVIAERSARGMSPEQLVEFERWHYAKLTAWIASRS